MFIKPFLKTFMVYKQFIKSKTTRSNFQLGGYINVLKKNIP